MIFLKEFVIGSCFIVIIPFLMVFKYLHEKNRIRNTNINHSYFHYSLYVPMWFGVWNSVSAFIAYHFNIGIDQRFLFISIFTYLFATIYATLSNAYIFTEKEWKRYYIIMSIAYFLIWNIIKNIEFKIK